VGESRNTLATTKPNISNCQRILLYNLLVKKKAQWIPLTVLTTLPSKVNHNVSIVTNPVVMGVEQKPIMSDPVKKMAPKSVISNPNKQEVLLNAPQKIVELKKYSPSLKAKCDKIALLMNSADKKEMLKNCEFIEKNEQKWKTDLAAGMAHITLKASKTGLSKDIRVQANGAIFILHDLLGKGTFTVQSVAIKQVKIINLCDGGNLNTLINQGTLTVQDQA
jgi:hypothetical protein